MRSFSRSALWYFLMPLCIQTLLAGCRETASSPADTYKTLCVERQDYTLNRRFTARIESQQKVEVRPVVGGTLVKECVKEGAQVKKGQPLFIIDQAPYIAAVDAAKAQVATARATLSTAQLNLEGKEKLYAQQMVGEFDLRRARHARDEAAAQLESAQAELASARTNLNYTTICSPVDGKISLLEFFEGELVDPSVELPITTIAVNNHIYAYFSLSEKLYTDLFEEYGCSSSSELISKLPPVTLYTTWDEQLPQKGHIDAVSGSADTSTGAVLLRASFNNPSEVFRNGSNGYIELPSTKHGVIAIPQDAVIRIQDKYFVYRVIEGKAVSTEITVLPSADNLHYVVISGLNERDVIIAENAGMVSEGMAIAQETKKTKP